MFKAFKSILFCISIQTMIALSSEQNLYFKIILKTALKTLY